MRRFFDNFRNRVIAAVDKEVIPYRPAKERLNRIISLGVLLWVVAEADDRFLPQEHDRIKQILKAYGKIKDEEMAIVFKAIEEAARERIDLYSFSREVSANLIYEAKKVIIEDLFRVACSDKDLDESEIEAIRKISGLFQLYHKDFIDAKIKIKKEFGLDTAGF